MSEKLQFVKQDESTTTLYIYGEIRKKSMFETFFEIEDETRVGAFDFKEALDKVDTPKLMVRINSMGGSVSEGLAIYNLLSSFPGEVVTIIDGFACSAASVIFMAGTKRIVPESSLLMIHNAWSSASGDSNALKKAAEDLEQITQPSVNVYVSKTGLEESTIKEMMDKETWIISSKAYDLGFATAIEKNEAQQSIGDAYLRKLILKCNEQEALISQYELNLKESEDDSFF